jgi:hypothetical protein
VGYLIQGGSSSSHLSISDKAELLLPLIHSSSNSLNP